MLRSSSKPVMAAFRLNLPFSVPRQIEVRQTTAPISSRERIVTRALVLAMTAACFTFVFASCGKRRPPLPPSERVPQRTELLSGIQRGNQVILSWPAPRRNAPDDSVQSIRRIDIYRLAEPTSAPLPLTEDEFGARATLIGSVPYDAILGSQDTLSYQDTLTLTEPVRLRYALRYVNASGQRAAFSNFLRVEPAVRISEPPVVATPEVGENAIVIRWQPPLANVDGSTPANILGYNIYRSDRSQNQLAQTPLNSAPLTRAEYVDRAFTFGEEYIYVVRTVSLGVGDVTQIESLNSNAVPSTPRDIFQPRAPERISLNGVRIVGDMARISIFFVANPERDVVGYNIFRSTDPQLPTDQWTQLTRTPTERTTFQDDTVQPGTRYYYYLTAVDNAGNSSSPSEFKSEIVP
ncbi:MAG: hypothetical protein M3458_04520 [Acidobacteriota bacterium]|nr:hypothetical protein [Acidobacteriota bacterium]